MKVLQLLPIGEFDSHLLESVGASLGRSMGIPWEARLRGVDPAFAFHPERLQYHSSELLGAMQSHLDQHTWRLLGVTDADLYIPILTFVFGEAQIGGPCAVVSTHRLRQEFYGLPRDPELLRQRLLKEAVHEIGHTLYLTHCDDYRCAMAPSHAVEWIDIKGAEFCNLCRGEACEGRGLAGRAGM
jgi:archaemetzincin